MRELPVRCPIVAGILVCAKDLGHAGSHYDSEIGLNWQTPAERQAETKEVTGHAR